MFRQAKTHKGRRFLEAREPKLIENAKTTMFIRGGRTSEIVTQALKDLVSNVQPLCYIYYTGTLIFQSPFAK